MSYTFFVPGRPVGKGRPRFTRQGHAYTPDKTKAYETLVKLCWKEAGGVKLTGPVFARIYARFAIPKSYPKSKAEKLRGHGYTGKPDADNIAKAVLDALNGLAYDDDSQVWGIHVCRLWCRTDEEEGVYVRLKEVK